MRVFERFRRRGPASDSSALEWLVIDAARTTEHPGLISRLLDRSVDGITVTGVFSPEEVDSALDTIDRTTLLPHVFGGLVGMSLGMIGPDEPDRGRYFDDTEHCRAVCLDGFGFDPHDRLARVLGPMASGRRLAPPTEDGRAYNPGQIRLWQPGLGGLPAHVGNEFREQLADGAMRHLLTVTRVTDHLSYFVVLRKPQRGGALSVYDLVWEQMSGGEADWANGCRDDAYFDSVPSTPIDPEPGSLVLFGGGWRWHRVDPVEGSQRVTYGGFAAPSIDGAELHFWA